MNDLVFIILAGNYEEAQYFARTNELKYWQYVRDSEDFRGHSDAIMLKVDSWYRRPVTLIAEFDYVKSMLNN